MNPNWQDLPAGSELDELIFISLGNTFEDPEKGKNFPPTRIVKVGFKNGTTLEFYIYHGVKDSFTYIRNNYEIAMGCYSDDNNDAFSLLEFADYFEIKTTENPGEIKCVITHKGHDGIGRADTVALAICRAWLDWKDQTAGVNTD